MKRRGFLENVFAQYDRIVSRHAHPPLPAPTDDLPPSMSPEEAKIEDGGGQGHQSDTQPSPSEAQSALQNDAGLGHLLGAGLAIKGAQSQLAQSSLRAALPELAEPLLGEAALGEAALGEAALGEAAVAAGAVAPTLLPGIGLGIAGIAGLNYLEDHMPTEQDFMTPVQPGEVTFEVDGKTVPAKTFHQANPPAKVESQPVTFKGDEEGLEAAYKNPLGTAYDPATKTEYVKGSVTPRDWFDDLTLIPFGNTASAQRYKQADKTYNQLQASGQPVKRIVGHSLGGSVALEMQKNHNIPSSRTFGAPVLDLNSRQNPERFRHPLDPFSVLDRGATWGRPTLNPHTYSGYEAFDS